MAKIIKEVANARRNRMDSQTRVKLPKNKQTITQEKKIRQWVQKQDRSAKSVHVLGRTVIDWQKVRNTRFEKYAYLSPCHAPRGQE